MACTHCVCPMALGISSIAWGPQATIQFAVCHFGNGESIVGILQNGITPSRRDGKKDARYNTSQYPMRCSILECNKCLAHANPTHPNTHRTLIQLEPHACMALCCSAFACRVWQIWKVHIGIFERNKRDRDGGQSTWKKKKKNIKGGIEVNELQE